MSELFLDKTYTGVNFTTQKFLKGEYDHCSFIDCNFEELHLSNLSFLECTFKECNLTNVKWGGTTLNNVRFEHCKILGADFSVCNPFMLDIGFKDCVLDLANFSVLEIHGTAFNNCSLQEVDFTETQLNNAIFPTCNFKGAIFDNTNLQKTDFTSAINYTIDPNQNQLKDTQFSIAGLSGLLKQHHIIIK